MQEIFKDVLGYEGLYEVSNLGKVRSWNGCGGNNLSRKFIRKIPKTLHPTLNTGRYPSCSLYKNKKRITRQVHNLIATAFIKPIYGKKYINHKDGNKENNNVKNLEWCTHSENIKHSYNILKRKPSHLGKFGKDHHTSKPIIQLSLDGKLINEFASASEANRITKISRSTISKCCLEAKNYKTTGGFRWMFKINYLVRGSERLRLLSIIPVIFVPLLL